jgi:hypothetical protein
MRALPVVFQNLIIFSKCKEKSEKIKKKKKFSNEILLVFPKTPREPMLSLTLFFNMYIHIKAFSLYHLFEIIFLKIFK